MRMPPDHYRGDALDDITKRKRAFLLGQAGMIDDLQQQIPKLLLKIAAVTALDRIGDLIGLLDRIVRDGFEGLFDIPRSAADRRAQRRHDFDEAGDIARWLHGMVS